MNNNQKNQNNWNLTDLELQDMYKDDMLSRENDESSIYEAWLEEEFGDYANEYLRNASIINARFNSERKAELDGLYDSCKKKASMRKKVSDILHANNLLSINGLVDSYKQKRLLEFHHYSVEKGALA